MEDYQTFNLEDYEKDNNVLRKINNLRQTHNIYIVAVDKRNKSYEQIKFMYVILKEISKELYGDISKGTIEELKNEFYGNFAKEMNLDTFRAKNCSVTTMKLFLDWLIKFSATELGVTISLELVADEFKNQWVYAMVMSRVCCVCGQRHQLNNGEFGYVDFHHIEKVGRAGRKNVDHTKLELITLCRKHHSEAHTIDVHTWKNTHGLNGIKLSKNDIEFLITKHQVKSFN